MSGYDPDVWKFFESNSFLSNNDERSFVLKRNNKMILGLIPLFLTVFMDIEEPVCPYNYHKIYAISILCLPALCVLLVFAVAMNQSFIKNHSKHYYTRNGTEKVLKTILFGFFIVGLTVGTQFIYGHYYPCYLAGPEPLVFNYPFQTEDEYKASVTKATSLSLIIGWVIIFGTLLVFAAFAIYVNIRSNIKPMDVLFKNFIIVRRQEMQTIIYDEIDRLAKANAKERTKGILDVSKDSKDGSVSLVDKFIKSAAKLEKEGDRLDPPIIPPAVVLDPPLVLYPPNFGLAPTKHRNEVK
ncbi:hypothetical protein RF11_02009 [Thelohanellus kitauei]|uniref:Uncharacterized protein n=1 Tax=Thelohanellus kitauei TaxID=669202 RepID=A0A0C2JFG7_THEKT|nr:hypothetical protein RF11_02009 [Thelohanellus kitauei]